MEPGVIVLLTYLNGTEPDGKPALARTAKSFTIQPERVAKGENVKATIKVKAKQPKSDNKPRENTELGSLSLSWPPSDILRSCIPDPGSGMVNCYVWVLDTVYYSMLDTKVPTVAARIKSTTDARYIDIIDLYFKIDATTSTEVYFSAGAVIRFGSTGSGPGYSADVYTIVLRNTRLSNNTDTAGIKSFYPEGRPGVYVVGFYGDVALARYREYAVVYPPDSPGLLATLLMYIS